MDEASVNETLDATVWNLDQARTKCSSLMEALGEIIASARVSLTRVAYNCIGPARLVESGRENDDQNDCR